MNYSDYELIALVRDVPYLYNRNLTLFRNSTAKERAFEEIGQKFVPALRGVQVHKRFVSLRNLFARKIHELPDDSDISLRGWPLMEAMLFLKPHITSADRNQQKPIEEKSLVAIDTKPAALFDDSANDSCGKTYDETTFIRMVRKRPELYDRHNEQYNNKHHKFQVWKQIGSCFRPKLSVEVCRRKFKSLRDAYTRKHRLDEQNADIANDAASDSPRYKCLQFLEPYMKNSRNRKRNESQNDDAIVDMANEAFEMTTETRAVKFEIEEVIWNEDSLSDLNDTSKLSYSFDDGLPFRTPTFGTVDEPATATMPIVRPVPASKLLSPEPRPKARSTAKKRKANDVTLAERSASPTVMKTAASPTVNGNSNDSIKDAILEAMNVFKEHCVQVSSQPTRLDLDEDDYFGLSMVQMIKKFPLAKRNMAKVKIHTYLSNLALDYDDDNLD